MPLSLDSLIKGTQSPRNPLPVVIAESKEMISLCGDDDGGECVYVRVRTCGINQTTLPPPTTTTSDYL